MMPEIVSDEYREGYAAFYRAVDVNPYYEHGSMAQFEDWEWGWLNAQMDWAELIGAN